MKRIIAFTLILALAVAGLALAAPGKLVRGANNEAIQMQSPYPAASTCTTTTTTKGTIATVSSLAGYSMLCWEASDSSNAAKRIKRHLGNNTAYMPGTGGCIALNKDMSSVTFKPYSGAGAAYTVCTELTRGGVTP